MVEASLWKAMGRACGVYKTGTLLPYYFLDLDCVDLVLRARFETPAHCLG